MTFGMIIMIPLVQLMLFGYAINTDARHLPVGLVDLSQTYESRALVHAVAATQSVDFDARYASLQAAQTAITHGDVRAILYLPPDMTTRLIQHAQYDPMQASNVLSQPVGQWIVDGSDTVVAATIKALRNMPLNEVANRTLRQTTPTFEVVQYFNPEQRTVVNIVPGLLAVILTMTMILFTATALVREQEQGNMEFLITTPIRPMELMIGKIVPYVVIGMLQIGIILGVGYGVFAVPVTGSLMALGMASLLFIFASLTLGLIISTVASTQLQAMQITVFILLPSILLSGFMFPYDAMPEGAQWVAEALPATHFIRMARAIVLRDASLLGLQNDALWLGLFTLVGLMIAARRFHKQLG